MKKFITILAIMSVLGFGYIAFGEVFQGYYQNVIIGVDVNEKNNTTSTNVTAVNTSSTNIFFQTATGTTICIGGDCKTSWPSGTVSFPIPYASTTGIQATLTFPLVVASTTDNTAFPIGLASTTGIQGTLSFPLGYASTTGIQALLSFPLAAASTTDNTSFPIAYASTTGIQGTITFPLVYASTTHLTVTTPLTITSGVLSIPTSTASQNGFLLSTDWIAFNAKITTTSLSSTATGLTYNNGTGAFSWTAGYVGLTTASSTSWTGKQDAITATTPMTLTNGILAMPTSTATQNGFLTSGDWTTFNNKQIALSFPLVYASSTHITIKAGNNIVVSTDANGSSTINVNPSFATSTITALNFTSATGTSVGFADNTTLKTGYKIFKFVIQNASTTPTSSSTVPVPFRRASTLNYIYCMTNGASVTLVGDERASTTPNAAGALVFNGAGIACDSDGATTSTFANTSIAADAMIYFAITSPPSNSTTSITVMGEYKED